jgi:hypothetical protein
MQAQLEKQLEPYRGVGLCTVNDPSRLKVGFVGDMDNVSLSYGKEDFVFKGEAVDKLLDVVGIRGRFLDSADLPLQKKVFESMLKSSRMSIVHKGGEAISISDKVGSVAPVDIMEVVGIAESVAGSGCKWERILPVNDNVVRMQLCTARSLPVSVGDTVNAGAEITFSPIMAVAPSVKPFSRVLSCTNGAVHYLSPFESKYDGEAGKFDSWMYGALSRSFKSLPSVVKGYDSLANRSITGSEKMKMLKEYFDRLKISDLGKRAILDRARGKGIRNVWDLYNLFTWYATHKQVLNKDVNRSYRALDIMFKKYSSYKEKCPTCGRVVVFD